MPDERFRRDMGLTGRTAAWGVAGSIAVALCVAGGLWLRLHLLSAEGFADDEVHKWLAAHRYLHGDFTGDDLEHPMLMKALIALCLALLPSGWAPETLTRLPNALAGGLFIWAVAQLGRRLFGRATGLLASALAVSATFVGYQRVANEDTLVGLFLLLLLWFVGEAAAAASDGRRHEQRRWELWGACALGAMFASKYYFFFAPIPVLAWLCLRRGGSEWRLPLRRWVQLVGVAFMVWAALNWTPFLPAAWPYLRDHLAGKHVETSTLLFMGRLYENLPLRLADGMPPSFYFVLAAVKLSPQLFLAALAGIALAVVQRRPAHRLLLVWAGFWYLVWLFSGGKYARFFIPVLPAFLLFASHALVVCAGAIALLHESARAPRPAAAPGRRALDAAAPGNAGGGGAAPGRVGGARDALPRSPRPPLHQPAGRRRTRAGVVLPALRLLRRRPSRDRRLAGEARRALRGDLFRGVLPAALYAGRFGRDDLLTTRTTKRESCRAGRVCYVTVQVGRTYLHNQDAVKLLSVRDPVHVETIRGQPVVQVYRLEPGESPFPAEATIGAR